ncbi:MAG TPA: IclR family transcriptional regulator [Desulfobacteraceae bacterium]|nr:IclR family transcriptional regulator [Desulfobacteraceae bacterium]
MAHKTKKVYTVPAISRALDVLEFLGTNPCVSFTEIHSSLGVPKSSIYQLLSTLESRGYVRRSGDGNRYELGLRLFELGNLSVSRLNVRSESLPVLRELAAATNQTVHIGILDGAEGVYLAKVESSRPIRIHSWEGKRIPLHSSSMGKVLLGWKPDDQTSDILADIDLPKNTEKTITDRDLLMAHLRTVRQKGWALDDQENEPDVRCLGAPVFDIEGSVIAAVSLSGSVTQMNDEALPGLLDSLLDGAKKISERLGNKPVNQSGRKWGRADR